MPGPKSAPVTRDALRPEVAEARSKAKPNRKSAARLAARRKHFDEVDVKGSPHGFTMHRPGSQNRNK